MPAADLLLADVADLAGTLQALDTDLLAALAASTPKQLADAGRALTDRTGHTAVRVAATECRLRFVPSDPPHPVRSQPIGSEEFLARRDQHASVGLASSAVTTARRRDQRPQVKPPVDNRPPRSQPDEANVDDRSSPVSFRSPALTGGRQAASQAKR